jgi:hypothetical protein
VPHRIIGPHSVIKIIVGTHIAEVGKSFYVPSAPRAVAGVDTLVRRNGTGFDGDYYYQQLTPDKIIMWGPRTKGTWPKAGPVAEIPPKALKGPKPPVSPDPAFLNWSNSVSLWVQDEAHHVQVGNKWGKAADMFPNARGLGVTATPDRADGGGLGRHADGLFDTLIEGPTMRALIDSGYLTDYRIFAPPSDLDMSDVNITASGEYNKDKLKKATRRSHIIGDVVEHYLRIAPGKLGITFASDVETATDIAARFNDAGVPAAVVSAKTPDAERIRVLRKFKNRELLQLVNCDLFGEGFDLPAIEVVSMARKTASFSLFVQQFGRALRVMVDEKYAENWGAYSDDQRLSIIAQSTKTHAIIIDHVGNIRMGLNDDGHPLPDSVMHWSLDRRDRRKSTPSDSMPLKTCLSPACAGVYEAFLKACPYCGHISKPAARNSPEQVDGDLIELDPAVLAEMRGAVARVDISPEEFRAKLAAKHVPLIGQVANIKRHVARQEAQEALRASIAWWGGWQRAQGREDSESYKRFFWKFGTDVLSAQVLNTDEALGLAECINEHLGEIGK